MHHEHPKLMRDYYWTKVAPNQLPYTLASEPFKGEYPLFSASKMNVSADDQEILHPEEETVSLGGENNAKRHLCRALCYRQSIIEQLARFLAAFSGV